MRVKRNQRKSRIIFLGKISRIILTSGSNSCFVLGMAATNRSVCCVSFMDGFVTVHPKNSSFGNFRCDVYGYSKDFCSILCSFCLLCPCLFIVVYYIARQSGSLRHAVCTSCSFFTNKFELKVRLFKLCSYMMMKVLKIYNTFMQKMCIISLGFVLNWFRLLTALMQYSYFPFLNVMQS